MTETPKLSLKLNIFARPLLNVSPFLSKSLPPGVQGKREKLGDRFAPRASKGPKHAGSNRVKI